MTALDIISQARERLGDKNKQRWTDERMLAIVSQGQADICIESGYLRRQAILPLNIDTTIYRLPSDCLTVKRVEYNGTLLPLHTRSDQDIPRTNITSEYTAYKSNLNTDRIEIQPAIPSLSMEIAYVKGDVVDDSLTITPLFGVITASDDTDIVINPLFGAVTGATNDLSTNPASDGYGEIAGSEADIISVDTPNGNFGVTVTAEYSSVTNKFGFITSVKGHDVSGFYGITANVSALKDTIKVYYIAVPSKLKFMNAVLVLPTMWEDLLMKYVIGTALQDDNDANNIQRGELELDKYAKKLATIKNLSSEDYSAMASDKYETQFRRV